MIREVFQHASQIGSVSFPSQRNGSQGARQGRRWPESPSGGGVSKGEVSQYETVAVKDWSSDDTEPGDDDEFSSVYHQVLDPVSGQMAPVSSEDDELV